MMRLGAPAGLRKIAAELERLDKAAAARTSGLPLTRAGVYGGLAGLGVHLGRQLFPSPDGMPIDPSETAMSAAGKSAAGGLAIAGLLNFLNHVTAKR
jgi:hypothetical protein